MKKNGILATCLALFACSCNQNGNHQNDDHQNNGNQKPTQQPRKSCCQVEKPSAVEISQQTTAVALPEVKEEVKVEPIVVPGETK